MNKEIKLQRNTIILFIVNILMILSMFIIKFYYNYKMYEKKLLTLIIIIDILIILFGIAYNFFLLISKKDNEKSIVIIITYATIFIILNTIVIYFINKPIALGYQKNALLLSNYCKENQCDNYYNVSHNNYREFVIKNTYFDYNNEENKIEIHIKYTSKNIISFKASIYSNSNLFSEKIIKDELEKYTLYFNKTLDEETIRKAFELRFDSEVENKGVIYKVSEIFKKENLVSLKTDVSFKVK